MGALQNVKRKIVDAYNQYRVRTALQEWSPPTREAKKADAPAVNERPYAPLWVGALGSDNPFIRYRAAEALGLSKDPCTIPLLIEALRDEGYEAIKNFVYTLDEFGKHAIPASENPDAKQSVVTALAGFGKAAIPYLVKALADENESVREGATEALGKIGNPFAVPALIEALKNESAGVRLIAVQALHEVGSQSTVPSLIGMLMDKYDLVQLNAISALERIVRQCETIEDFENVEKEIDEGSAALRKGRVDKGTLINAQMKIAKLTRNIAVMKDDLAPKRDLLLDDKPEPPKKGRGVYQTARMIRNG